MKHRVIMEAILDAHQTAEEYGGTWYVLNDDFFSVVRESYFIEENGARKEKPFVSVYNTDDKYYGQGGIGQLFTYESGCLGKVPKDSELMVKYEDFKQPYGNKELGFKDLIVGHVGVGTSTADHAARIAMMSHKTPMVGKPLNEIIEDDNSIKITNPYSSLPEILFSKHKSKQRFGGPQNAPKKQKRKKKGKKTHRKK